jgi:hypothetical protein
MIPPVLSGKKMPMLTLSSTRSMTVLDDRTQSADVLLNSVGREMELVHLV